MLPVERGTTRPIKKPEPKKPAPKKAEPKPARSAVAAGLAAKMRAMDAFDARRDPPKASKPKASKPAASRPSSAAATGLANKVRAMNAMDARRDPPKAAKKDEGGGVDPALKFNAGALTSAVINAKNPRDNRERWKVGDLNLTKGVKKAYSPTNTPATRWSTGLGGAVSVAQLPGAVTGTAQAWKDAIKGKGSYNDALNNTAGLASLSANSVKSALELRTLAKEVDQVPRDVRNAIHKQTLRLARSGNIEGARALQWNSGRLTDAMSKRIINRTGDVGGDALKREVQTRLGQSATRAQPKAVANAVRKAGVKGLEKAAARGGARFVPGLNIAVATADTAAAISTLRDPKANGVKKTTAVLTAAGSWAAATNIPIVSQGGAVVSSVASIVGDGKGVTKVGKAIGHGAKKVGKKVGGWLNPFD